MLPRGDTRGVLPRVGIFPGNSDYARQRSCYLVDAFAWFAKFPGGT